MSDTEHPIVPASRRHFVTQLGVGSLALVAAGCARSAVVTPPTGAPVPAAPAPPPSADNRPGRTAPPIPIPPTTQDGPWDHAWLAKLSGARHKLVFDIGA